MAPRKSAISRVRRPFQRARVMCGWNARRSGSGRPPARRARPWRRARQRAPRLDAGPQGSALRCSKRPVPAMRSSKRGARTRLSAAARSFGERAFDLADEAQGQVKLLLVLPAEIGAVVHRVDQQVADASGGRMATNRRCMGGYNRSLHRIDPHAGNRRAMSEGKTVDWRLRLIARLPTTSAAASKGHLRQSAPTARSCPIIDVALQLASKANAAVRGHADLFP